MKNIIILLFCVFCLAACGDGSSTSVGNGEYTVSGIVTSGGSALSSVTVTFTGTSSGSVTTASDGSFSFTGVNNGVYQVTAAKAGYIITPASIPVTVANANVTGQNFTATAASYNVTGSVKAGGTGLAGVTVTLSGTTFTGSSATVTGTTDLNGSYTIGVINGTFSISAAKTGCTFSPSSISVTVANADQTVQDITASPASYTLSGTITSGGNPLSGAIVTLNTGASTTTNSSGNYNFSLNSGSYIITPSMAGYNFTPTSASVTINNADSTGNNFTAALNTYTISGTITYGGNPLPGVTVSLSGSTTGSTTTDASGNYNFSAINGSYTVTPSMTGYNFTQTSTSVTINNADSTGKNFIAALNTYTISGTATYGGNPLPGVTVSLSGSTTGSTTTDASGNYSFIVNNGSYTITPSMTGFNFTQASTSVTINNADSTGKNFTAALNTYAISGTVTRGGNALSGVTVTLSGSSTGSTTTNASGNYSFIVNNGSYTITPSKPSFTFTPASANVTVTNADSTANNFTGTTTTQTQLLVNNSFESGLTGWTTATDFGGGATGTCSYNAATAPGTETLTSVAGFPATDGTQITLGSVSQATGGGLIISCVLYQDVAIPVGATTATFSFDIGIKNASNNNNNDNAVRVGIYSTASVPTFPGVSIINVTYAQPTDVTLQSRASTSFDVSSRAGTTVRFAIINAANNSGHENIGIDNVKLTVTVVN